MTGVICKREVCAHPIVTIRCFGLKIFLYVLFAGSNQTFLDLVVRHSNLAPPQVNVTRLIGRCIKLEHRANRLYNCLKLRLQHHIDISTFLSNLSDQELEHAELLEVCQKLADKKHWHYARFNQWKKSLPGLEQDMEKAEQQSKLIKTDREALKLVLLIESSEINSIFSGIISATDSSFVRSLNIFQQAEQKHIDYICDYISHMEPDLSDDCKKLKNNDNLETEFDCPIN